MVQTIGDSLLPNLINIRDLYDYHKIKPVDMNMNVNRLYSDFKLSNSDNEFRNEFLKILPKNSVLLLYLKRMDLSKKDYHETISIKKIAQFKNNTVKKYESVN